MRLFIVVYQYRQNNSDIHDLPILINFKYGLS
jgi:hypothetical protein